MQDHITSIVTVLTLTIVWIVCGVYNKRMVEKHVGSSFGDPDHGLAIAGGPIATCFIVVLLALGGVARGYGALIRAADKYLP